MNEMNTAHLVISGIAGGVIGSFLTGFGFIQFRSKWGMWVSKLTSPRGKFDEIECKELKVVDRHGKAGVILASDAPYIGKREWISHDYADKGEGVIIYGNEHCGNVIVKSKSKTKYNAASLFASERGGRVGVFDEYDSNKGNSEGAVEIIIDEHGGYVEVSSGKSKGRAAMGVNEHGDGTFSTWDKHGYRQ